MGAREAGREDQEYRVVKTHLFVPDTQVRAGVPVNHIPAAGRYAAEKKPDVIVLAGDWFDMPATSRWNSKQEQEGLRIADDINAGNEALASFMEPIEAERARLRRNKDKGWNPEIHVTLGNHEYHIQRYVEEHPELVGLISYDLLDFEKWGIIVHDFKVPVCLDGVWYCHFFYSPNTGRPLSGMMETRLKNISHSFTQGHTQGFKCGQLERPNGRTDHGLVAGSFYQHNEDYRGPQATNEWRGIVMKHEVKNGEYNIMQVSLQFLLRRYGD